MRSAFSFARSWRRYAARAALLCGVLAGGIGAAAAAGTEPLPDEMVKAVQFNDVATVRKMLAAGVDPNAVDARGMPLLAIAARQKSDGVAKLLAARPSIDLDATDRAGENALMFAALNGDASLARFLIDHGAEVNKTGWTPLHYAASSGADEIVKMLLDASAYIDAGSPNGTTPLMMAARGGHIRTVKLLLDEGADMTIKNQLGLTVIDFAKRYNQTEIADGLASRLRKMQAPVAPAAASAPATPATPATPAKASAGPAAAASPAVAASSGGVSKYDEPEYRGH